MKRMLIITIVLSLICVSVAYAYTPYKYTDDWFCDKCNAATNVLNIICSNCGAEMSRIKLKLNIKFASNLLFSKYGLNVYLDDKLIASLEHGEDLYRYYRVTHETHYLKIQKADDESVYEIFEIPAMVDDYTNFVILRDVLFECSLRTTGSGIEFEKVDISKLKEYDDVAFYHPINRVHYWLTFDMDSNTFTEYTKWSTSSSFKDGDFEGNFQDGITLIFRGGRRQKMVCIYEKGDVYSGAGYYLYPIDEKGKIDKNEMQWRNYIQVNISDYYSR